MKEFFRILAFGGFALSRLIVISISLIIFSNNSITAENSSSGSSGASFGFPEYENYIYDLNNLRLSISNYGVIGSANDFHYKASCEYPAYSYNEYMKFANLWIGGIVGEDTLVTTAGIINLPLAIINDTEMWPDGPFIMRSKIKTSPYYSKETHSDLDLIATYTDTLSNSMPYGARPQDSEDNRSHIPLYVSVTQSSYAWSYNYADDFIIFDYKIKNVGEQPIKELYMGIHAYPMVGNRRNLMGLSGGSDDGTIGWGNSREDEIVGFKGISDLWSEPCFPQSILDIMWWADNDGDPTKNMRWNFESVPDVASIHFIRKPAGAVNVNFNWFINSDYWIYNFGPRLIDSYRQFKIGSGYPDGDKNKYYLLSNKEVDYDQLFTALDHQSEGFYPPPGPGFSWYIASGTLATPVLSVGPVNLQPGDSAIYTTALIISEDFHDNPYDYAAKHNPYNPDVFYNTLNFNDMIENATWASFTFDNPGVDTDGDGYSGEYIWKCNCERNDTCFAVGDHPPDTTRECCFKRYYTGDGVPDFRTAAPPPPPVVKTVPDYGKMTVRWNGQDSEQYIDFMTQQNGFEGYKVYMGEFNRADDFVLVKTYDREDFRMFEFDDNSGKWRGLYLGITRDSLKSLYGNDFNPEEYFDENHTFYDGYADKYYYFELQSWNQSDLTDPNGIVKVYPNASRHDPNDTTEDGYLRYYEYEYTIDNLSPSREYYFNVTAFNKGNFNPRVGVMESSVTANSIRDFALPPSEEVQRKGLNVMVYPNPYRIDGGYARAGYENRSRQKSAERSRAIHFANLPPVCSIRIYTIDGDLVRYIKHWHPEGGPGSQEETWNVISRNTQAITTGIYIWHVRSDMGEQTGKLVIMK